MSSIWAPSPRLKETAFFVADRRLDTLFKRSIAHAAQVDRLEKAIAKIQAKLKQQKQKKKAKKTKKKDKKTNKTRTVA